MSMEMISLEKIYFYESISHHIFLYFWENVGKTCKKTGMKGRNEMNFEKNSAR